MTRRDAVKQGAGTAISAALLSSADGKSVAATERNNLDGVALAGSGVELSFMRAVDMVQHRPTSSALVQSRCTGATPPNLALDIAAGA
jgi:hypothetical protein